MRRVAAFLFAITLMIMLPACGSPSPEEVNGFTPEPAAQSSDPADSESMEAVPAGVSEASDEPAETIPVILTLGRTEMEGVLYDSAPAQSFAEQLPVTLMVSNSGNDFCGGSLDISYGENDVESGYSNGEIAFWTPASNLVLFISGEEASESVSGLVPLGRITSAPENWAQADGLMELTVRRADEPADAVPEDPESNAEEKNEMNVKITVGDTELYSVWENNPTSRALAEQMPMTLPMMDLYGREMCYRFGADAFPAEELRSDEYAIGDIVYWPPSGSLVILYAQNGERFGRQQLGRIDSGVEVFESTGDANVTFELQ